VPRRLNALVSRVLLLGAIDQLDIIDERVAEAVVADLGGDISPEIESDGDATRQAVASAAPAADEREERADVDRLRALQAEVEALNGAIAHGESESDHAPEELVESDDAGRVAELEARLARAETRLDEQDEVLRRILSKLIEWVERDAKNGPFASRVA
jgi:hypothetical protein